MKVLVVSIVMTSSAQAQDIVAILNSLKERFEAVENVREAKFTEYTKVVKEAQAISTLPSIGEADNWNLQIESWLNSNSMYGELEYGNWVYECAAIFGINMHLELIIHDSPLSLDDILPLDQPWGPEHIYGFCFEYRDTIGVSRAKLYPTPEAVNIDPLAQEKWLRESAIWFVAQVKADTISYKRKELKWIHLGEALTEVKIKSLDREQFGDLMNQISYVLDEVKGEYIQVGQSFTGVAGEIIPKRERFERFDELSMPSFGGGIRFSTLPYVAYQVKRLQVLPYAIRYKHYNAGGVIQMGAMFLNEGVLDVHKVDDRVVGRFGHTLVTYIEGGNSASIAGESSKFNWRVPGEKPKGLGQVLVINNINTWGSPSTNATNGWQILSAKNHKEAPGRSYEEKNDQLNIGGLFESEFRTFWKVDFDDSKLDLWSEVSLPKAVASAGDWIVNTEGPYRFVMNLGDGKDVRSSGSLVIRAPSQVGANNNYDGNLAFHDVLELVGSSEDFVSEYSDPTLTYTPAVARQVKSIWSRNDANIDDVYVISKEYAGDAYRRLQKRRLTSLTGKRLAIVITEVGPLERQLKLYRVKDGVKAMEAYNVITIKMLAAPSNANSPSSERPYVWQISENAGLKRSARIENMSIVSDHWKCTYTSAKQPGYALVKESSYDKATKILTTSETEGGVTSVIKSTLHPFSSGPRDVLYPIVKVHRNDDGDDEGLSPEERIETYTYHRWPKELEAGETPEAGSRNFFYSLKSVTSQVSDQKKAQP